MKKKLIISVAVYAVLLSGFVTSKVIKGDEGYYNYKKSIKAAQKELDNLHKETKNESSNNSSSAASGNNSTSIGNQTNTVNNPVNDQDKYAGIKFTRQLFQGRTGDDVKKLQYILKEKGFYKDEITGNFDKNTFNALVEYQKEMKIKPADGILGQTTWKTFEQ